MIAKGDFEIFESHICDVFVFMNGLALGSGISCGNLKFFDENGMMTKQGLIMDTYLREMYANMPKWNEDLSKFKNYHIPIFKFGEYFPNVFASLHENPLKPVISENDESAAITAYWFYQYPEYHEDVLRYLEVHQKYLNTKKNRQGFLMDFRHQCILLMFSVYHVRHYVVNAQRNILMNLLFYS